MAESPWPRLRPADSADCEEISKLVYNVLEEAIGLYKSYGFVEYQPEHLSARCDQAYMLELK